MNEEMVYLKPNLVIEPLVGKWYAWSHLISPATAALNITKRHMEIMNSLIPIHILMTIMQKCFIFKIPKTV
jgi:hypothetical protein